MLPEHPIVKKKLADFEKNIFSQFGEDGVIEKIFEIIGTGSKVCIEFGAWDGFHLSNTANLWKNKGWKGVLIEGNKARFKELLQNIKPYNCVGINNYVGREEHNRLETLLKSANINDEIDLLSIDIDGDDYYIIESLHNLRPRVLIAEYNPTIPAHLDIYPNYKNYFGSSAAAISRMAESKGYKLVAMTLGSCFFVLEKYFGPFAGFETNLRNLKSDEYLINLVTGFDGKYTIIGHSSYGFTTPYRGKLSGEIKNFHTINIMSLIKNYLRFFLKQIRNELYSMLRISKK